MLVSGTLEVGQPIFVANVFRSELTAAQQQTYNEAIPIVTGSYYTTIINTTANLEISRMTNDLLVETPTEIDFLTLSIEDQDKLRNLLALFVSVSQEEEE